MKFHTFYTDTISSQIVEDHKSCCNHIGIDVKYHQKPFTTYDEVYTEHGNIMTSVLKNAEPNEVVCFLDIDCLPHNLDVLKTAYHYAKDNQSFVGNAQNISHTPLRNRLYAAPSMLMIHRECWVQLGSPSLSWFIQNQQQIDTAQILTLRADEIGYTYRLMYPIGYDETPEYQLSGYGVYGRGTLYPATYHWFRMSDFKNSIPEIWSQRVNNILTNQSIQSNYSSCFYV